MLGTHQFLTVATECTVSLYRVPLQGEGPLFPNHHLSNFYGKVIYAPVFKFQQKFGVGLLCFASGNRSVKRETLKLIETFLDKAEDQPQIGKQFVPPMMDPILGDYARNVPDARESEVLSLFATIINKYSFVLHHFLLLIASKQKS